MYEISIANIEYVKREISKSGLTYSHLMDDMIDHVCCDVEYEMQSGTPFEKAYERVKEKIGAIGLMRIQDDTLFLIDKNYRIMKKLMQIFGVLSPILMAIGGMFKIMHWPGAGIMLVLGFFFATCIFLPSAIYVSYKEISNRTKKWTYLMGFIGIFFLIVSFLFKIMHWPGAAIVLLGGAFFTCFVFLPLLLANKLKEKASVVPRYIYVIAFIGFLAQLTGFTFKIMHWPGASAMFLGGIILFVLISIPLYAYNRYKEAQQVEGSFIYIILVVAWFVMPTTLLSLNVERFILSANFETENIIRSDISFMEDSNELLFNNLAGNAKALIVKKEVDNLTSYIQQLKVDMVLSPNNKRNAEIVNDQNEINLNRLTLGTSIDAARRVITIHRANELSSKIHALREVLLSVSNQESYSVFINKTLPDKLNDEIFPDPSVMISVMNNLSFLQLSVLMSEKACYTELIASQAVEKVNLAMKN